jgi:hypothetical protein
MVMLKHRFNLGTEAGNEDKTWQGNKFVAISLWLGTGVWLLAMPWLVYNNLQVLNERAKDLTSLITYLKRESAAQSYWISDSAIIVYSADRQMPPLAMNLAFPRTFGSYAFGRDELEKVITHYPVTGIVLTSGYRQDPKMISWIRTQFPVSTVVPGDSLDTTAHVYSRRQRDAERDR